MFTGIITGIGRIQKKIKRNEIVEFHIDAGKIARRLQKKDSLCVSGVCLTVVRKKGALAVFQAVPETLKATNLGEWEEGRYVNLEPSLRAADPLGGHFVSGHVDGVGKILEMKRGKESLTLKIQPPKPIMPYIVSKGSVTLDGISLTVQKVLEGGSFTIAIIPYTLQHTTLKYRSSGDSVNLESDFFAKYIEKYLKPENRSRLTVQYLTSQGY